MKQFTCFVIGAILCAVGYSSPNNLILIVEKEQQQVKMLWNFSRLPENVTGFQLQKRSSTQEKWENVGNSNIRFGMTKKNIKNVDISDEMKDQLLQKYAKLSAKDDRLTSKNINDYLQKHPDEKNFLLWALCMDYETSLISGLGFIDEFESSENTWEYRVLPIINKKIRAEWASQPVTIKNQDNFSKNIHLKTAFVKYDDKINIHMNASKETFESNHIKGYVAYTLKDDGSKIPVNRYLSIPKRKKQGYVAVASVKEIDPTNAHTFVIQPVTIFDTRCEPILVNYNPN